MEIGITWENKLVYNKEINVNKKALKVGAIAVGASVAALLLIVSITPPQAVYAYDTGRMFHDAAATNANGKVITDTILNTPQAKDLKMFWDYTKNSNDFITNEGLLKYVKTTAVDIHKATTGFDIDFVLDRYVDYTKGEIDILKVFKNCMFN